MYFNGLPTKPLQPVPQTNCWQNKIYLHVVMAKKNAKEPCMHSSANFQSPISAVFFCSRNKVYRKQEVRFRLYLPGD